MCIIYLWQFQLKPWSHSLNHPPSQALLNEISSYEANIQSVEQEAQELVSSGHFALDTVEEQGRELQHRWSELKRLAARRTRKLSDALEAQKVSKTDQEWWKMPTTFVSLQNTM